MSFKDAKIAENTAPKLYTGVTEMTVLCCNPTLAQLKQIYNTDNITTEPVYKVKGNDGSESTRLDFILKKEDPNIITKVSIFVNNNNKIAQSGKTQFINNHGQSCWEMSLEEAKNNEKLAKWFIFDTDTTRIAKEGEVLLYDFLNAAFNIQVGTKETNVKLESFEKIVAGDVSEINGLLKYFKDKAMQTNTAANLVKVLLGVKNGKYQDVYGKAFARSNGYNTYILNQAKNTPGGFSSYYTEVFQEFKEPTGGTEITTNSHQQNAEKPSNPFANDMPEHNPFDQGSTANAGDLNNLF